jgi:hypothetical protein
MEVRVRSTGAVMFDHEFRQLQTGLGFPKEINEAILNEWGADIVYEGPQASGGTVYQYSMRSGVVHIGDKWYTNYILGPVFTDTPASEGQPAKTAAENETAYKAMKDAEQAASVRASRTQMLKDCDWTQIADSTADKAAWATYRQALRDITSASGFPWTMTWPNDPNWVAPTT